VDQNSELLRTAPPLQADREKELKAVQEAELHRAVEAAAKEAALERQKKEEEEKLKK